MTDIDPHASLRDDVSRLGHLLGELLEELEGKSVFAHVELARMTARERRDGVRGAHQRFTRLLGGLSAEEATAVSRAFSTFFVLVNLAERVHRLRRIAEAGAPARDDGFDAAVARLVDGGLSSDRIESVINQALFKPVFTAHPTEAVRRTLLYKEQRIARALLGRITLPVGTDPLEPVRDEMALAWQTDEHFSQPSVSDEVEHVLFYLARVLYDTVPEVHRRLGAALERVLGANHGLRIPSRMLRFGSWVGADMDGNPNVGAETILRTLARQREAIIARYREEMRELFDHLSQSQSRIRPSAALTDLIEALLAQHRTIAADIPDRYADMPYRVFTSILWHRLGDTLTEGPARYDAPGEFVGDLQLLLQSVNGHGGTGARRIQALIDKVRCFGFHLAALDVRQDAAVHRRAVAQALGEPDFETWPATRRAARLRDALAARSLPAVVEGEPLTASLDVMRAIRECLQRFGHESIGLYIISMARDVDDALAPLLLARLAGLDPRTTPLDVAPLFETVDDLEHAPVTLDALLADSGYRAHLGTREHRQFVMLGYSDSNKQAGIAASRFALHQAQRALVQRAEADGDLSLTLFHGRGGTISRGGGEPRNGILAEPPGSLDGRLRVTEQGEIIGQKYGLRDTAVNTLESALGAVMERAVATRLQPPEDVPWSDAAAEVARASRQAYETLLAEPRLVPYFRHATPIDVIERLRIGSRPASRQRGGGGVESLRAIPWVFAWSQSRHAITGWYGLGQGLRRALEAFDLQTLRDMARGWRFFATLLSDAEMVMAKSDMGIARLYAELAPPEVAGLHAVLEAEFDATRDALCEILEQDHLLAHNPLLARTLSLRDAYVDPLHLIQVDFLRRWRDAGREEPDAQRVLAQTVRGIARGMQNTG